MLKVKNLKASVNGREILKGVDLEVGAGELHVLMGPNGSGKSTLAQVIMGAPQFTVHPTSSVRLRSGLRGASSSPIMFNGVDITKLTPDKRAKLGIFLGFQHPVEIPGVSVFNFLRRAKQAVNSPMSLRADSVNSPQAPRSNLDSGPFNVQGKQAFRQKDLQSEARMTKRESTTSATALYNRITKAKDSFNASAFRQELFEYASSLRLGEDFLRRSVNEGFSGGEKKRNEILQMMALSPKLVILDEIDSGLDVDGLKLVAKAISAYVKESPLASMLLITHYARILRYLKPDFVHVMVEGKIVKSGKMNLAKKIEEKGYSQVNF